MATAPKVVSLRPAGTRAVITRFRRRSGARQRVVAKDDWSLPRPVKGGLLRSLFRLVQVLAVAAYYGLRALWTRIRVWNGAKRTLEYAALLREAFESAGGTFVKIGQQLSMRRDMLPPAYCQALEGLLDNVKEFPFPQARAAIESQIGGPVSTVFERLNPQPIGRASIACVYEAWLVAKIGKPPKRVAVKVRRPGIVNRIAADLRVLDWVFGLVEHLGIFRIGFSGSFRAQLKEILFDELDFRIEARFQELFRHQYKKHKNYHVSAPRIYYRHSGAAVMVSGFVDGIPLEDVTSALMARDEEYLLYLRGLGIHPVRLARRLIRYNFHAFFEDTFFHGDPHPANIFVLPEDKLVFVDFGACGTFSRRDRNLMWQMHYFHARQDIRGMVECVIGLMEPLPPVDIEEFRGKLEKYYWDGYYGLQSKHSDWRDRTSYRLWVALYELVREYQIPIPLNMLRMMRATLLYDTMAAQLYPKVDVFKEFRKYERTVAERLQVEFFRDATRQELCGPDLHWYLTIRRLFEMGRTAVFRLQKFLDEPGFSFSALADKVSYFVTTTTRWLLSLASASLLFETFLFLTYHIGVTPSKGITETKTVGEIGYWETLGRFLLPLYWPQFAHLAQSTMTIFFIVVTIITVGYLRTLSFRFHDPDVRG